VEELILLTLDLPRISAKRFDVLSIFLSSLILTCTTQKVGTWAKQNLLDGVDFDLEDIGAGFVVPGVSDVVQFLVDISVSAATAFGMIWQERKMRVGNTVG
jgi:hypothetical protein